jgi:hypothetical protein
LQDKEDEILRGRREERGELQWGDDIFIAP